MIYDITMITTYAQIENANQFIEVDETTQESTQTQTVEQIASPTTSPFLIFFAVVSIGVFLYFGYFLIKKFKL